MVIKRLKVVCFFLLLQGVIWVSAQSILVGVRDNQYARIGYTCKHWSGILEHSVFTSKFKNQVLNGYVGYQSQTGQLEYRGTLYGGFQYNKLYHSYGGMCEGKYLLTSWCYVEGGIRPHYDSSYGYETAYLGEVGFKLHQEIYLTTSYTNYPEYRLCEERIKGGLLIKVRNLEVKPELSIPVHSKMENLRFLLSFDYELKLK